MGDCCQRSNLIRQGSPVKSHNLNIRAEKRKPRSSSLAWAQLGLEKCVVSNLQIMTYLLFHSAWLICHGIDASVCLSVCLSLPEKFWTTWYPLPTLDHQVPFANLGPQGILCQPLTTSQPLSTMDHQASFANLGQIGTLCQSWIITYLLSALDHQVPFATLVYYLPNGQLWNTRDPCPPWTTRYLLPTLDYSWTTCTYVMDLCLWHRFVTMIQTSTYGIDLYLWYKVGTLDLGQTTIYILDCVDLIDLTDLQMDKDEGATQLLQCLVPYLKSALVPYGWILGN